MSNQDESGVPFEICNVRQNLRLLELPPSLLELLKSGIQPSLSLKSSAPNLAEGGHPTPSHVVLCTNNQTFHVRQVHSSNTVFIVQPLECRVSKEDSISTQGLAAIAQCAATLELIPTSPSGIAHLRQILPIHKGFEASLGNGAASQNTMMSSEKRSKNAIVEDAPLSPWEFEKAWIDLCAFEQEDQAWLPSAQSLASIWKSIMAAATVRGLSLDDTFATTSIVEIVEEDDHPAALLSAVLKRIAPNARDLMDGYASVDRDICVSWVGVVLLESQHAATPVPDFIQKWQDRLPEDWRKFALLEVLKGKFSQPTKDTIIFNESSVDVGGPASSTSTATTGKASRKWHEKFKNARR